MLHPLSLQLKIAGTALFGLVFGWASWPTLTNIISVWSDEPDYSHGYLVVPICFFLLWKRRADCPTIISGIAWGGLSLIGLSIVARVLGAVFFIDSLDGWSIPLWIAGMIWLLFGRSIMVWSVPAVAFLWFMIPLPWRVERLLSHPLQRVATDGSTYLLQCLGQPAIAQNNIILLGDYQLEVSQACIGLRMFLGITALSFFYVVLLKRSWLQKAMVLASIGPVAISTNIVRITTTGLFYQYVSSQAARTFSHDIAGWVMVPLAAVFFATILWWMDNLFVTFQMAEQRELVHHRRPTSDRDSFLTQTQQH